MTTLTKSVLDIRAAVMNGTSTLPLLYDIHRPNPDNEDRHRYSATTTVFGWATAA